MQCRDGAHARFSPAHASFRNDDYQLLIITLDMLRFTPNSGALGIPSTIHKYCTELLLKYTSNCERF